MIRCRAIVPLLLIAFASCTDGKSPLAPTTIAAPAPPLVAPPLPTTVPGVLALGLPIDGADYATTAFGIMPFGVHGPGDAVEGHPGWDIEYAPGAFVRAAAAGTVLAVDESAATGSFAVQIEHVVGSHFYRTTYANLATVSADITEAAEVRVGQRLGTPGAAGALGTPSASSLSGTVGIHFQLDDLEFHREGPDPKAVTPESFLSPAARSLFDALWARAAYAHELVEPFATNPRSLSFPVSRTWIRAGGDGPAGIRFTRSRLQAAEYEYALLAESGTVIEAGAVAMNVMARPYPFIALTSPTAVRLGLYDIVSNEMRLALANPGAPRANDLSGATIYRTSR